MEEENPPCKKQKVSEDDKTDCEVIGGAQLTDLRPEDSNLTQDHSEKGDIPSTEHDVGIVEYISSHEGFNGIIKQRFSDFMVHEISLDGSMAQLTDISEPECDKQLSEKNTTSTDVLSGSDRKQLKHLEEKQCTEVLIEVGNDKEKRGAIHQLIRQTYTNLESSTIDKDGKKYIKVVQSSGNKGHGGRNAPWPSDRGDICKFILYKENKDTMEAINLLAKFLRIKSNALTYAGTKDKRGKTTQFVTISRFTASRLHALNKTLRGIALGNFRYCKEKLKLGDLKGNHFTVVLRNVTGTRSQVERAVSSLKEIGFINYFGMQRFGTTSVPTHHIGRAILKSNWEEAIELILKPRKQDGDDIAEARDIWWTTRDAKAALDKLGYRGSIEKQLLTGLDRYKDNDLVSALNMIPRNTRLMYIHAYQSYIWNKVVTRKMKEHGVSLVVGDLVLKSDAQEIEDDGIEASSKPRATPILLTSDNLKDFSIYDVVLPLPGHDVIYPANDTSQWYSDILKEHVMDKLSFKHKVRDYSLPGNYRKMIIKPENVDWQMMQYEDYTVPLIRSDLDMIKEEEQVITPTDGKLTALKLEFALPSSAYATMVLREVLKTDTSAAHQTTLNVS